jgi:LacI family transcriptional regulator
MGEGSKGVARMVTLQEVASRAGVSVSTASRALTGARKVSVEIAEQVRLAAEGLGYRPNQAARNLRLSRSMTLGAVFSSFSSPIYLDFLEGLGRASQEHGYTLLTMTAHRDPNLYQTLIQHLLERRVDALFCVLPPELGNTLKPCVATGVPVVTVFGQATNAECAPLLIVDEDEAILQAASRLADLDHRTILYLCTPEGAVSSRVPALQTAASRCGLVVELEVAPRSEGATADQEQIAALLRRCLCRPRPPTAVFVDQCTASLVIRALASLPIRVPEDLSLVVFGESDWIQGLGLPWSTIRADLLEVGQTGMRLILDWLAGSPPPAITRIGTATWIERGSVGPAPAR